jgi:methionyl aminopeptidase
VNRNSARSASPATIRIMLHGEEDFTAMRAAGRLAAETLDFIAPHVQPGITTDELNRLCHDFTAAAGAICAPLNYKGFPKSICTSVNEVVCHGIPADRPLLDGDIINIDVTPLVAGWHGDSSRMYYVGQVAETTRRLVDITYECMMRGIQAVRPGARLGDIGHAIQSHAEAAGYSVVRSFCGHGIGKVFHTAPQILHFGRAGSGPELRAGMFFTIEPMINIGGPDVALQADGWTALTADGSLSAQFEHTVGVTRDGVEIFTLSPADLHQPPFA